MLRTVLAVSMLSFTIPAFAESPGIEWISQMPAIANALGVKCNYCHSAKRGSGIPEPKKEIAKAMMAMTDEINTRLVAAVGKEAAQTTSIRCAYCHRGVAIPKPITDIVWQTTREKGVVAATDQYRELRKEFYGRNTYDFSDEPLAMLANQLASYKPDDAIALASLNLEFHPKSVNTLVSMSNALSRKHEDDDAIAMLEKAVSFEPENGVVRGRLEQLKGYRRK
ncbi:MAG: photosynthetic reaction center cytochrome c subunit [Bryobacterales bacterium]|nr:photosynthetic reaction center cytochrome c subunit [Bryobacterales bacterium]